MNIKSELNILEPWEHGTEDSISVTFIDKNGDNYLICLDKTHTINGYAFLYFIVKFKEEGLNISKIKGVHAIEMGYDKELSKENFTNYNLDNFRGNFLLGEVVF